MHPQRVFPEAADLFRGRRLLIATQHGKEKVIAPLMTKYFHTCCVVSPECHTDRYGTFSGETERKDDPLTTLRRKCNETMDELGYDLGIASEGSFGPHPLIPFAAADEEWILLSDKKSGLEFSCRVISPRTNFAAATVHHADELMDFAAKAGFPRHGLILRSPENIAQLYKGIRKRKELLQAYQQLCNREGTVMVETDMRAMMNPTRMQQIRRAAQKLAQILRRRCRSCGCPGLSVREVREGLPCSLCGCPTRSTLSHILICPSCAHTTERRYPHKKRMEDPMYCDHCNP